MEFRRNSGILGVMIQSVSTGFLIRDQGNGTHGFIGVTVVLIPSCFGVAAFGPFGPGAGHDEKSPFEIGNIHLQLEIYPTLMFDDQRI